MIIGNSSVVEFLTTSLEGVPHARTYAFIGPNQIGKRTLAFGLAQQLLQCTPGQLRAHPDFYYIERLTDEKTGKLKKDITVEQARNLKSRIGSRPWAAKHSVVVINEAELLNTEAGNALLKLLEEPPEQTIIFLLSENDQALLPTIRSRAQLLYFSLVTESVICSDLRDRGATEAEATEMAKAAWGRPGKALEFLASPEVYQGYAEERTRWQRLSGEPFYVRVKATEALLGEGDEGVRGRERLSGVLSSWEFFFREALLAHSMLAQQTPQTQVWAIPPSQMVTVIDTIAEGRRLLRQNIHPALILEHILLAF